MKTYLLLLALVLVGCASADTTPVESETPIPPAEASSPNLSSDPLMAEGDPLPAPEGALSTPVEPAPMPEAPSPESMETEASLSAATDTASSVSTDTETTASSATDTATSTAASTPSEPIPPPATPKESKAMPPVVAGASDRDTYEEYREYKNRVKDRASSERDLDQRALFPHEDGAFQFGFDYAYKPFPDLDFDPTTAVKHADSEGATLSFNYFPVRSLSYGRLGLGLQAGAYWSKLDVLATSGKNETSEKHLIDTYGARLIYEFQYFLGQTIVPFAFYGYDKVRMRDFALHGVNYAGRTFNAQSYGGGAHLNLNRLESSAASKALATTGIRKFYLTYTFLTSAENTGASHYLGLRFEY